jgi:hypothetical protein
VPATVVAPVIEAPPVVTVRVLEIVAVPALLKLPDVTLRPFPAVSSPPTLKIPESDSLPTVRVPIYALAVLIVVVDRPPARVVKLAPVTPKVPATVVAPVIEAPPVVTVRVFEIVAVPALLKFPEVILRPFPAVSNPPTLKIPESDSFPTVRVPIYAEAVLIVVVDKPLLRTVSPPTVSPPVVIETALL